MNAEIGFEAVPVAQNLINNISDRTIPLEVNHADGVESAIGYLQLLSDKSHV